MRGWVGGILAVLVVAPADVLGQGPQFRGGPAHRGLADGGGTERFGGVAWRFETGGTVRSSAALSGGVLYVGSSDGVLYAVDADAGTAVWRYDAGAPVASSPAVAGEVVLVGSRDGVLHGVAKADGRPLWRLPTGPDLALPWGREGWDYLLSSPAVADGRAYWGSGDGHVYAVDPSSGGELWRFRTGGRVRSTPAVADGRVVVGSGDGVVYALDGATGAELWSFETAGVELNAEDFGYDRRQITASPAIADGVVYVGSRDASLYALDAGDGRLLWTFDEPSAWVIASAAVNGDRVFSARSSSGHIRALDRESGNEAWVVSAGAPVFSSPVLAGSVLHVGQGDGDLAAYDATTGEELWSYRTGGGIWATPLVRHGRIYVGSDDRFVYALAGTGGPAVERAVFFDEELRRRSVFGSEEPHLRARDFFVARGYELLNSGTLAEFVEARLDDRAPSVVVFAMDALPEELAEPGDDRPLLRRYLDGGGKVVWMGYPPGYFVRDAETGEARSADPERPAALLDVDFGAFTGDVYGVTPTDAGRARGLSLPWVGPGTTRPSEVGTVLAVDEIGRAVAWMKEYGGPPGRGFVMTRAAVSETVLAEIQRVAEHGLVVPGGRR